MTEPTSPPRPPSRRRLALAGLAVLVPLIPIMIGLSLGGAGGRASASTTTSRFTPVTSPAPATSARARATRPGLLPPGTGAVVAAVGHPTTLHTRPGGPTFATLASHTGFGSPTFVLVSRLHGPWLGVIATQSPNNRVGWIRASDVSLSRNHWQLHAVLSRHELIVSHDGKAIRHFTIAIGAPAAPTPTGHFAVTDRLTTGDPGGPYGCCILALSAKAPHAISGWDGGNRIAIHSTPETDSIGKSVSHGCMRLTLAEGRWLLAHIPLGTPATVST